MLFKQTCLVSLITFLCLAGSQILTRPRLEMINTIAMDLGFTCVTLVVEEVDRIGMGERKQLSKINLPLVIFEMDDIEELFNLKGNDDIKCISFVFLERFILQTFLNFLTDDYHGQLEMTSWFLWMTTQDIELDMRHFGLGSDVSLLIEQNGVTTLTDVYSVDKDQEPIRISYGTYSKSSGLVLKNVDKWKRRTNLQGITLRTIVLEQAGYLEKKEKGSECSWRNVNKVPWGGIFPEIFESIAESLNFSFAITSSRDGNWGSYEAATDTWNGAVKDIKEDVADLAASSVTINKIRSTAVDFSIPIVSSTNCFLVSATPSYSLDIFSRPFHGDTWLFLYSTIVTMACFLALVARVGREEKIAEFKLVKSFVFVYGAFSALAARRWSVTPMRISGR